ncbi:MAG: VOC family protein [Phycisphaerae bacterium]|nr:VOC family protein [Phycisphaerae bacterium]
MAAPVVHFEIGCRDIKATRSFYGTLFGWSFDEGGPNMAMVNNIGAHAAKKTDGIGGHLNALGHEPHKYVTIYVMVPDIGATLAQVQKLGGKAIVPKTEVPGMGHFAWFEDVAGNVVGLWTPMTR